jgi:hypothetical protein
MKITPRGAWTSYRPAFSAPQRNVAYGRVHHEGGPVRGVPADKAGTLRQIESYVLGMGYIAIDYNLMVFQDGDVWEGRGLPNEDAATKDHNTDSVSICAVGNFETEAAPDVMVNAIGQAFREAANQGWLRGNASIYPHSATYQTACPGRNLNAKMGAVRAAFGGSTSGGDWFDMATIDDLKNAVRAVLNEGTAQGQKNWAGTSKATLATAQGLVNQQIEDTKQILDAIDTQGK